MAIAYHADSARPEPTTGFDPYRPWKRTRRDFSKVQSLALAMASSRDGLIRGDFVSVATWRALVSRGMIVELFCPRTRRFLGYEITATGREMAGRSPACRFWLDEWKTNEARS